ncbi:YceI family protein [bacterium SCSIO 12741]|nr:YceI family protein [bacterium SCSIO 12741]
MKLIWQTAVLGLALVAFGCNSEGASNSAKNQDSTTEAGSMTQADAPAKAYEYLLNKEESSVDWMGNKPTGSHNGNISFSNGAMGFNGNMDLNHGVVEVDMTTITCIDIQDEEDNKDFVGHLKNEDFFDVTKYPTANLMVMSMTQKGSDGTFQIEGEIVIKGINRIVSFEAQRKMNGDQMIFDGILILDRTEFNVTYKSKSVFGDLGDKFIYDEFTLNFHLVFDPVR